MSNSSHSTVQSFSDFLWWQSFFWENRRSVFLLHTPVSFTREVRTQGAQTFLEQVSKPLGSSCAARVTGEVIVCVKERFRCFFYPLRSSADRDVCCCTLSECSISPICSYNNLLFNPCMWCELPELRLSLDSMPTRLLYRPVTSSPQPSLKLIPDFLIQGCSSYTVILGIQWVWLKIQTVPWKFQPHPHRTV